MCKRRTCKFITQSCVTVHDRLHLKVIEIFIIVKTFGSYWIHQSKDQSGSIKMSRYGGKSCFNQWTNGSWRRRDIYIYISCLGFISRTFTIHRTAGEEGGYFVKCSLPLLSALQTLSH